MLVANRTAARQSRVACYHWGRFHIDDAGHHGDWEEREPRTIHIRFSRVPDSIQVALYGLRAIERQFGPIRDYRLLRDSEIRSEYQAICWAAFQSPRSLLGVPVQGTMLKVPLPPPLDRPDGGPGLDDLRCIFAREDRNSSASQDESSELTRFITLSIKRAGAAIAFRRTTKPPFRSRAMKAAIGHSFLEWGGFAHLEPLYQSSPYASPVQESPPVDSKHMRMALNKWCQILGVADPLFPETRQQYPVKTETSQKDVNDDWQPLSEPFWRAASAEAVEVPDNARETLRQSLESLLQRPQLLPAQGSTKDEPWIRGEKT